MTKVLQAKLNDLEEIIQIDSEIIGDKSRKNYLKQSIDEGRCFVGQIDGEIVGYIVFDTHFYGNSFISLIIVRPSHRRKGVAKN